MKNVIKNLLYIIPLVASINVLAGHGWSRINYTNSTIFTGIVTVNGVPADSGDVIGIFVNGECRMVSTVFNQNDTSYVSAVLHGDKIETATISYWNAKEDKTYTVDTVITTAPSKEIMNFPIKIKSNTEETVSKNVVATNNSISIYPTIAKTSISVSTTLTINSITIFNNIGNIVSILTEPNLNHIDVSSLSCGLYFISVKAKNGTTITKKFIKN